MTISISVSSAAKAGIFYIEIENEVFIRLSGHAIFLSMRTIRCIAIERKKSNPNTNIVL